MTCLKGSHILVREKDILTKTFITVYTLKYSLNDHAILEEFIFKQVPERCIGLQEVQRVRAVGIPG